MKPLRLYVIAIVAFTCKTLGAFWDVSYHFRHLRELTQASHILNAAGNVVLVILTFYLWKVTPKSENKSVRWMIIGLLIFASAIPIDDTWHRIAGIDLQIWSPPHLLLYAGSAFMVIGWMLRVQKDRKLGRLTERARAVLLMLFSVFLFDVLWFILLQHEHGVVAGDLMSRGLFRADYGIMAQFAAGKGLLYGNTASLWYPLWSAFFLGLSSQLLAWLRVHKFACTIVIGLYCALRLVSYGFLWSISYPLPALPLHLLISALGLDLVRMTMKQGSWMTHALLAIVAAVPLSLYALLPLSNAFIPSFPITSLPLAVLSAWAGVQSISLLTHGHASSLSPRGRRFPARQSPQA